MKQVIKELRDITSTFTKEDQRFSVDVKEGGQATQLSFVKVTHAANRMHSQIQKLILRLEALIEKLQ